MSLNTLLDPIGFIADVIAICNALEVKTPQQRKESEHLLKEIDAIAHGISNIENQIAQTKMKILNAISTAVATNLVSEISTLLPNPAFGTEAIETVVKLLFMIKTASVSVVFAIVIRHMVGDNVATLGMAASTTEFIRDMTIKLNNLARSTKGSERPMTALVSARCRGKHDLEAESFISALLCCLVTEALGLPSVGGAESMHTCALRPSGKKTIVILRPEPVVRDYPHYNKFSRIFLVGESRTGKSSLGNALTQTNTFATSEGMTGTLHVSCQDVLQTRDGKHYLAEVCDTPGLNDKDGLDVYHQAAIEDKIVGLQEASAFILTIAVGSGITYAAKHAIDKYKFLFGEKVTDMLSIVLTIDKSADEEACKNKIDLNWDTIVGLVEGIRKSNIEFISLEDLRSKDKSYSHSVVQELLKKCQTKDMEPIYSLSLKFNKIREALLGKRDEVDREVKELVKIGWLQYEELTSSFESAPQCMIANMVFHGFVYKHSSRGALAATVATLGAWNLIRKFAIHVKCPERRGRELWNKFQDEGLTTSMHAMRIFGDQVHKAGLAVLVRSGKPTRCGTLSIHRSYVTVFNPAHEVLIIVQPFLNELFEDEEEIAPDVADRLAQLEIPGRQPARARYHTRSRVLRNLIMYL